MGAGQFACILGSFTASFAVVLPSFLIVLAIVKAYDRFKENPIFQGVLDGLKPAVVGLIGAAAILLITPENFPDWKSWIIFAAALVATLVGKINPIVTIIAGGVAGILIY